MRTLSYTITLREKTGLPIHVASSEIRMKILELLYPQLDVQAIDFVASETKE